MCVYAEEASLNNKALSNITQGHMALKAQTCCSKEDLETFLAAECVLEGTETAVEFKKYCLGQERLDKQINRDNLSDNTHRNKNVLWNI